MFKRPLFIPLAVALCSVALTGGSAFATDEVPAPPAPSAPSGQPSGGTPAPCVDSINPAASIKTSAKGAKRNRVVRGKARDNSNCAASGKLDHVAVSVSRSATVGKSARKKCRFMSSRGKLGKAKSCSRQTWLSARGTKNWAFGLPVSLGHGSYTVKVQAVDSAGNVSRSRSLRVRI
jgi:hypothetical protein